MAWEGINQRKFPRVSYKCRIRVWKGAKRQTIEALTENIGAGGICVVLKKKFRLFEDVSLEIYMGPDGAPIGCAGTVVWVVKKHPARSAEPVRYDTGLEFHDISQKDRQRISNLVDAILIDG